MNDHVLIWGFMLFVRISEFYHWSLTCPLYRSRNKPCYFSQCTDRTLSFYFYFDLGWGYTTVYMCVCVSNQIRCFDLETDSYVSGWRGCMVSLYLMMSALPCGRWLEFLHYLNYLQCLIESSRVHNASHDPPGLARPTAK